MPWKIIGSFTVFLGLYYSFMRFDIILRIFHNGTINSDIVMIILPVISIIIGSYFIKKGMKSK